MCVYIYIYTCMYTLCMYVYIYIYIHINIHKHTNINTHVVFAEAWDFCTPPECSNCQWTTRNNDDTSNTYVSVYICIYVYVYVSVYVYVYIYIYIYICVVCVCVYVCIVYIYIYIYIYCPHARGVLLAVVQVLGQEGAVRLRHLGTRCCKVRQTRGKIRQKYDDAWQNVTTCDNICQQVCT